MTIESGTVTSVLTSDDGDLECRSISELVSILRTAFRVQDFDKVEEVLVAKEVKLRKEIENKNKEYELLQSNYDLLKLDNGSTLQEDKVDPKGFEKWKQMYEDLKERERELLKLKELIIKVDEDREKKKRALEGFEKLLEAVKKTQENDRMTIEDLKLKNSELECSVELLEKTKEDHEKAIEELRCKNFKLEWSVEDLKCRKTELERTLEVVKKTEEADRKHIEELKCKNSKLECAKRETEHKYELSRRKYDELGRRVSQLENTSTMLKNGDHIAPNRNDSTSGGAYFGCSRKMGGKGGAENDKIDSRTGTGGCAVEIISDDDHAPMENLSRAHRNQKRKWDLLLNDCEDYVAEMDDEKMALKKVGPLFATPPHGRPDNHVLKKHFSPDINNFKNVVSSSKSVAVMVREESKSHNSKFKYASVDVDYNYSIYADSEGNLQNRYDSKRLKSKNQEKRHEEKWESEAEMCSAFDESDMLCMEAVCILYRQSSFIATPFSSYFPSRQRGFHEADVLRGTTLALFLTNGSSQGKLKRSAMELEKFDICGLVDCRRIAIEHSKQLFEIYKNNEDNSYYSRKTTAF